MIGFIFSQIFILNHESHQYMLGAIITSTGQTVPQLCWLLCQYCENSMTLGMQKYPANYGSSMGVLLL